MPNTRRPRGPMSASANRFIGGWMPDEMVKKMDAAVNGQDSDRSKFLRAAVREKLERIKHASA